MAAPRGPHPVRGAGGPHPVRNVAPGPPSKPSPLAPWSLGLGIAGLTFFVLALPTPLGLFTGALGGNLALPCSIMALVFGIVARNQTSDPRSRSQALAGLILGGIVVGIFVTFLVFVAVMFALCCAACNSSGPFAVAPCAAGAVVGRTRHGPLDIAHHPDLPCFDQDVFRVAGRRVCAGCATAAPAFVAAWLAADLLALPGAASLAVGLALALAQGASALGWTRLRWQKVAVKAAAGAGAAVAAHAVLEAPWPWWAQAAALAAGLGVAWLSTRPRRRRIGHAVAATLGSRP